MRVRFLQAVSLLVIAVLCSLAFAPNSPPDPPNLEEDVKIEYLPQTAKRHPKLESALMQLAYKDRGSGREIGASAGAGRHLV